MGLTCFLCGKRPRIDPTSALPRNLTRVSPPLVAGGTPDRPQSLHRQLRDGHPTSLSTACCGRDNRPTSLSTASAGGTTDRPFFRRLTRDMNTLARCIPPIAARPNEPGAAFEIFSQGSKRALSEEAHRKGILGGHPRAFAPDSLGGGGVYAATPDLARLLSSGARTPRPTGSCRRPS